MSFAEPRPFSAVDSAVIRHDWTRAEVRALFALPFPELIFRAQTIHRQHFDPTEVQISTLISIKTGGCPEDCAYCPQSARYETGVRAEKIMPLAAVLAEARAAKDAGASRFCMGAAWREPKDRDLDAVCALVGRRTPHLPQVHEHLRRSPQHDRRHPRDLYHGRVARCPQLECRRW